MTAWGRMHYQQRSQQPGTGKQETRPKGIAAAPPAGAAPAAPSLGQTESARAPPCQPAAGQGCHELELSSAVAGWQQGMSSDAPVCAAKARLLVHAAPGPYCCCSHQPCTVGNPPACKPLSCRFPSPTACLGLPPFLINTSSSTALTLGTTRASGGAAPDSTAPKSSSQYLPSIRSNLAESSHLGHHQGIRQRCPRQHRLQILLAVTALHGVDAHRTLAAPKAQLGQRLLVWL